jgi:hypothetical protein
LNSLQSDALRGSSIMEVQLQADDGRVASLIFNPREHGGMIGYGDRVSVRCVGRKIVSFSKR